jgi:hypothetical protein
MAKQQVELDIKVNGADEINDFNKSLQETNVSFEDVATSSLNLTKAIAGSFELATQAAGLFGEKTGKAFEETTKRAQEYIALSNALKDVAEGFSKENIKGLTSIVSNFQKAGGSAKVFGVVSKTAIAGTGIGLLVIALGALVANWEAVSDAVLDFIDSIPFLKQIKDTIEALIERVGSLSNLFSGIGAFIKGAFTAGTSAVEEFNKAIEQGKAVAVLQKQAEVLKEVNENRQNQIKLLQEQGKHEQEIFDLQKQIAQQSITNLEKRKAAGEELSKDDAKRLKDLQLEIQLLEIRNQKFNTDQAKKAADELQKKNDEKTKKEIQNIADEFAARQKANEELEFDAVQFNDYESTQSRKRVEEATDNAKIIEKAQDDLHKQTVNQYEEVAGLDKSLSETREKELEKRREEFAQLREEFEAYSNLSGEFIQSASDAINANIQNSIDGLNSQIDGLDIKLQESIAERQTAEALLADADGVRRDQILADIQKQGDKEKELANQKKKLQNEIIKAQNKANQVEYANAIIQSTIRTAQAVLAALTTVPPASFALAAITAVLAGIQTAIVVSQKPKDIPLLASGGFTEGQGFRDSTGHEVAGTVHANEYVVPSRVLGTPEGSHMVGMLEAMRQGRPKFADGGFTTPVINVASQQFDPSFFVNAVKGMNLTVAVVDINEGQQRVNVIESRAGIQ